MTGAWRPLAGYSRLKSGYSAARAVSRFKSAKSPFDADKLHHRIASNTLAIA